MKKNYTHNFVEQHEGLIAFGWDRKTDEDAVICYLQMFSDDLLMKKIRSRLSNAELDELYSLINRLLKNHLSDEEYHLLFLKENHP